MQITQKEYIKNFIIRSMQGKVDKTEAEKVRNNLLNCSREDWKDLKVIGRELAKEAVDEKIDKESKIPNDWKEIGRGLSHSGIDLLFAIFNEEVLYQGMLLEKQGGLDQQTRMIKFLPVISQSIDRIVARAPAKPVSNWKADKNLTAKIKKIFGEIKGMYFQGRMSEEEIKQKMVKLAKIWESLTAEEIAVLKNKLKILANKLIDRYAPDQIKNSPEIRQFINSSMNLIDTIADEKICKELTNISTKVLEQAISNKSLWKEKNPLRVFQKTGTEAEIKNLINNFSQHLTKLAGAGEENNLSNEREESIVQRLMQNNSNPQPSQEDTSLENIWKDNLLTQGISSGSSQMNLMEEDLLEVFEEVMLDTQIKPKWYQNPWIIWPLVAGAFVIGGLLTWWLTRSPKKEKTDKFGY